MSQKYIPTKLDKPDSLVLDKPVALYTPVTMARAKKIGDSLAKFVKQNELSTEIAGKQYIYAEGWQFVGTQLGLTSIVKYCDPVKTENEKEIKYKSEVEVINNKGTVISRGIAYCSNQESKKTKFEEYAVASMAQTRAVGKAYRNFLSWIVKMAGYEATPADEIDKDKMETDFNKTKQKVYKAFQDAGITDSTAMMNTIETAIGKRAIDNMDDANKVLAYIRELEGEDE